MPWWPTRNLHVTDFDARILSSIRKEQSGKRGLPFNHNSRRDVSVKQGTQSKPDLPKSVDASFRSSPTLWSSSQIMYVSPTCTIACRDIPFSPFAFRSAFIEL